MEQLILGDCLEKMKEIPDKSIDLVLTDPPYGIGEDGGKARTRGKTLANHVKRDWDNQIPSKEYFDEIFRISKNQAIFGGNYFTEYLPPSRGWVYWRKLMGGDFSDGELIWTSFDCVLKEYTKPNKGFVTQHPTQKPVDVMKYLINRFSEEGQTICDPFMGSGTTGVACVHTRRNFIGIEKDETYFSIASERIKNAQLPLI